MRNLVLGGAALAATALVGCGGATTSTVVEAPIQTVAPTPVPTAAPPSVCYFSMSFEYGGLHYSVDASVADPAGVCSALIAKLNSAQSVYTYAPLESAPNASVVCTIAGNVSIYNDKDGALACAAVANSGGTSGA